MKNIFQFLFLAYCLFTSTNPLLAQWIQGTGTIGTSVFALAISGTNLFAGCMEGVYLSTDNGTNWTAINTGLTNKTNTRALAVSGTNLFAGTLGGVFLSTNNGTSWTEANTGIPAAPVKAFAISGTNIFAGTMGSGVFLSTNNGTSWTAVNTGLTGLTNTSVYTLAVSETNLFAGTWGGGVFLSTNNGTSWTAANNGLTNKYVTAFTVSGSDLFAATEGGGVFLSTNNGTSWTSVNTGLTSSNVYALAVSDTNLFAGTWGGGVFLSTNNGTSWTSVNTGFTNTMIYALAVSGTNLFAGTYGGGIFKRPLSEMVLVHSQYFIHETEPNNDQSTANPIIVGDTIMGSISPAGDVDYYTFTISKIDTVLISLSLVNNSQLSASAKLTGNITSEQYYGNALLEILGGGTYYLIVSSPTSQNISTNNSKKLDITGNSKPTINKVLINGKDYDYPIMETLNNGQIFMMKNNHANFIQTSTGDYQVIITKFIPKPAIDPATNFTNPDYDYNWSSIFDGTSNSIRVRVYFYPNGPNTTIKWEYGVDNNYGNDKAYPGTFNGIQDYCAISTLSGLSPNTLYHYRVHISNNAGDTYSNDNTFTTPSVRDNNIAFINPAIFKNINDTSYLASAGGPFYYTIPSLNFQSIAFQDNLNGWIVGDYINFIHTNDGGTTWQQKKGVIKIWYGTNNIYFSDKLHGFLIGDADSLYIFNTKDGGNTWNQLNSIYYSSSSSNSSGGPPGSISFSDSLHGTIVGYGGTEADAASYNEEIMHTTDGANTWQTQNKSLLGTWNIFNGVSFSDTMHGTIVGTNHQGGVILYTTNGGSTWQQNLYLQNLLGKLEFSGVSFSDILHGTIIGYESDNNLPRGIIFHTTDGGITWNQQYSDFINGNSFFSNVSFSDSLNGIVVGGNGTILKTSNGGTTWNHIASGTKNNLNSVTLLKNNTFLITGAWGTILKGNIVTSVKEQNKIIPIKFELSQNYPNPFNPNTTIEYSIPHQSVVSISVYDLLGREVVVLVNEEKSAGNYSIRFNISNLTSGVYFYRLQAGTYSDTKKLIVLK